MRIMVTGGAGFIGSAVCRYLIGRTDHAILNVDKLTYAGNLDSLREIAESPRYSFARVDIGDRAGVDALFADFAPQAVIHLAAESHVDRSIDAASTFVDTNIIGTLNLLEASRRCLARGADHDSFRFLHVSTDEVYGSLGPEGQFSESTAYNPRSPYAATKASADHLVRAWQATYGVPAIVSNCSNNYGPYHFPEKLIPLAILNGIENRSIPIYGDGSNIRDWLHVDDHAHALSCILARGTPGRSYNVGANNERSNVELVARICDHLDQHIPQRAPHRRLMTFVSDRPGHDRRYAIDTRRMRDELGWRAQIPFEAGLAATVHWYIANEWWWRPLRHRYSGERLGLAEAKAR